MPDRCPDCGEPIASHTALTCTAGYVSLPELLDVAKAACNYRTSRDLVSGSRYAVELDEALASLYGETPDA